MDNEQMILSEDQVNTVDDQLEHWGIKGMRWGLRRYQYADGSLTPAGKKRYNADVEKLKKQNAKLDAEIKGKKAHDRATARVEKLKAEAAAKKAQLKGLKDDEKAKKKQAKADSDKAKAEVKADKKAKELEESLTRKDLEMQTKKAAILRSGDPVKILENGHLFNDQEIDAAYTRLASEGRIRSLIPEKKSIEFLRSAYSDIVVPVTKDVATDYIKDKLGLNKPNAKTLADIAKVKADTAKVLAETREKTAEAVKKELANEADEKAAKAAEKASKAAKKAAEEEAKADKATKKAAEDQAKAKKAEEDEKARKAAAEERAKAEKARLAEKAKKAAEEEKARKAAAEERAKAEKARLAEKAKKAAEEEKARKAAAEERARAEKARLAERARKAAEEARARKAAAEKRAKKAVEKIEYEILDAPPGHKSSTQRSQDSSWTKKYSTNSSPKTYEAVKGIHYTESSASTPKLPASSPVALLPAPSGGWIPALKSSSGNTSIASLPPATKNQVLQLLEKFD